MRKTYYFSPVILPEITKQLIALKQRVAEDVEIPVSPTLIAMRGTIYQNSEAEQSSCPSPPPLTESSQSIESLRNRYTIFTHIFIYFYFINTNYFYY